MASAAYMREWRKLHRGALPAGDPRHGTRGIALELRRLLK